MKNLRPEILVLVPYYLPGYKAGGALRTVSAMVEKFGRDFRFRVLTSDRDAGDETPYSEAEERNWVEVDDASVRYLAPREQSLRKLYRVLRPLRPDLLYLNAYYHPVFTFRPLLLRRAGLLSDVPVLLAPRGHLSPGARSIKPWRKQAYIALTRMLALLDGVVFHASDELERGEILEVFPNADVRVAPDMVPSLASKHRDYQSPPADSNHEAESGSGLNKQPGRLRVVFLSRVAPEKNLTALLEALAPVSGKVELSIVGPVGDSGYWSACQELIGELPDNVAAIYRGPVPHHEVPEILSVHHLLALPTRSENFGHVIREALQVGRPVLISDRTPWTRVESAGAGWVCPLEERGCLSRALEAAVAMDQEAFEARCRAAQTYIEEIQERRDAPARTRSLLRSVMDKHRSETAT